MTGWRCWAPCVAALPGCGRRAPCHRRLVERTWRPSSLGMATSPGIAPAADENMMPVWARRAD
eukprot:1658089-Pyramimonas_sp.AAC.1